MAEDVLTIHDSSISQLASGSAVAGDLFAFNHAGVNKSAALSTLGALLAVIPAYVAAGTPVASTFHFVFDEVTAAGASTTVTLTAPSAFASANYIVLVQDEAAPGTWIAASAQLAGSFTFTSTDTHVYQYIAVGV